MRAFIKHTLRVSGAGVLLLAFFVFLMLPQSGAAAVEGEAPAGPGGPAGVTEEVLPDEGTGTVRIAVLPWKVNAEERFSYLGGALSDMLSSRVGSVEGVGIMRGDLVRDALGSRSAADITEAEALEIGKRLGAGYVLYGSVSVMGDMVSLDARLMDVARGEAAHVYRTGEGLDSIVLLAGGLSGDVLFAAKGIRREEPAPVSYTGRFARTEEAGGRAEGEGMEAGAAAAMAGEEGPAADDDPGFIVRKGAKKKDKRLSWKAPLTGGMVKAVLAADLDGDGAKEILLLSDSELVVALAGSSGIRKIKTMYRGTPGEYVSMTAFDGDGDGRDEVYVSGLGASHPDGCILEHTGGDYRLTGCGIPFLMRAVGVEGERRVLLGQGFRREWGYGGGVKVLAREGDGVIAAGDFDLPEDVNLYGFEVFDISGGGENSVVSLDARRHLRVYRKGQEGGGWRQEWRSPDRYDGTLNEVKLTAGGEGQGAKSVPVHGVFHYSDLDGNGVNELVIKANVAGGVFGERSAKVMFYKSGVIKALEWDGLVLEETWSTREISGYISDFVLDDINGDGRSELLMVVVDKDSIFKGEPESSLVSYTLPAR